VNWQVAILRFSRTTSALTDVSPDERMTLGSVAHVRSAVSQVFSGTIWDDAGGLWTSDEGSIRFDTGRRDPIDEMHLRVSGELAPQILDLCEANRWSAIDFSDPLVFMSREREAQRAAMRAPFQSRFLPT
jgi:hypothetical protein